MITSIPGNHDIGLGDGIQRPHLHRFQTNFAAPENKSSNLIPLCNANLFLIDTPSLLNHQDTQIFLPPAQFLKSVSSARTSDQAFVFTHIPLYRPPNTPCGPLREAKIGIREGGGYQYQNMLSDEITTALLEDVWPVDAIFSGDDHDYCVIEHSLEGWPEVVPEYTVKSFSSAMVNSIL
jgi:ethanolamine phosphate phosphodiesterase